MKFVVALGNPGKEYEKTRHNAGFLLLDDILGPVTWENNKKFKALSYKVGEILFLKPQTFMNESGQSVQAALSFYKMLPKKLGLFSKKDSDLNGLLTVIHDDVDIELGKYKIASDSGSAGHNGIKSIIQYLKTQKFTRLRIGIKTELKGKIPTDKFVLGQLREEELKTILNLAEEIKIKKLI
ncbi:MAG: aminoacyl-tRNA hydrolase [Planctomycetes bacterium]|jgi:PTH1 family peptidyl-tRNA hydrolase|nr:aminoacyl-tRNA hydrolase [Planctomycetota bacterium]